MELLTDTQMLLQGISAAQSLAPAEREVSRILCVQASTELYTPLGISVESRGLDLLHHALVWGRSPAGLGLMMSLL